MRTYPFHKTPRRKTYNSWRDMRRRCRNPEDRDYANYGGRGITVCDRWNSFDAFVEDMGLRPDGLTLDRIDVNGNYEPANCRWADRSTQSSNQRRATGWGIGISQTKSGSYRAYVYRNGKFIHLGTFPTADEARQARASHEDPH